MDLAVRELVRRRARDACEYCHLPQAATELIPFHLEHVIAQQHVYDEGIENLALACDRCNAYKSPNFSSVDPLSNDIVSLFHPRHDVWSDHFCIEAAIIAGISPRGRATVKLLQMNASGRIELREQWLQEGGVF